jgi:hypothetical protein
VVFVSQLWWIRKPTPDHLLHTPRDDISGWSPVPHPFFQVSIWTKIPQSQPPQVGPEFSVQFVPLGHIGGVWGGWSSDKVRNICGIHHTRLAHAEKAYTFVIRLSTDYWEMHFEIFVIGRDSSPSRWWWAFCTFSHRVKLLPDLLGVALLFLCCLESPISTYLYALQNARIVEADARLHYTAIFVYFKLSMFFCTFFVTIVWCFCVLSTKEASSRRASSSRFEMRAQSTFRCWYHRPFYTPLTTDGSHASWKLRIRSVCVYIYDMYV